MALKRKFEHPWQEPRYLPNELGFEFVGRTKDGREMRLHIALHKTTGLHTVAGAARYYDLECWRPL